MKKRQYTKRSAYWDQPRKQEIKVSPSIVPPAPVDVPYWMSEDAHFTALAACGGGQTTTGANYRNTFSGSLRETTRYRNIRQGLNPFQLEAGGHFSMSDAISLVSLAYWNYGLLRNAINLLQDFSISKLHVETNNKTVKNFFESWFNAINLDDLMSQFFLEYYRSGNVFLYKFVGRIEKERFERLRTVTAAKTDKLPIRYIILNPAQISLQMGTTQKNVFVKMLSTYEIARLRNPQTPEEKQMFDSLPKNIRDEISNSNTTQSIFVPLDPKRLFYAFYRKQDYEPLAVPMAYPVLNDIEYKLELKRMDMALARTIEHVILLVTTGETPSQFNPTGLNPKNLDAIRTIFQNQTIGRVFVADYTTKAQWIIPDLKEILGKGKYEQVEEDIRQGLQFALFGNEKFANAVIKAKIFIEGLREGRRVFLNNFLMPEVVKICEAMNFKHVPKLTFEEVDVEDKTARERLLFQMAQNGFLTDEELINAMQTGLLPPKEVSLQNQKRFMKERQEGLYKPMIGGNQSDEGGRPNGISTPLSQKTVKPIGTRARYSQKKVIETIASINALQEGIEQALKKKFKIKNDLSESQKLIARSLAKSIAVNENKEKWQEKIAHYIDNPKDISKTITKDLDSIALEHDVDDWISVILWISRIE